MLGLTGNNLGLIGGANSLNGLVGGGYNSYGGSGIGFMGYGGSVTDATRAKEQMTNNYSIYATQQGLNQKQQAETLAYGQQSQNINTLIKQNRTDYAMDKFEQLVSNIKGTPQYAMYSDAEVRAIAQEQYANANGTRIINDIDQKSSSALVQGLKMGTPILGLFESNNSKEDFTSRITGTPVAPGDTAQKIIGSVLPGAALVTAGVAGFKTIGNASRGAIADSIVGLAKKIPGMTKGRGKVALVVAGILGAMGIAGGILKATAGDKAVH